MVAGTTFSIMFHHVPSFSIIFHHFPSFSIRNPAGYRICQDELVRLGGAILVQLLGSWDEKVGRFFIVMRQVPRP
jgi:hypothetical protein